MEVPLQVKESTLVKKPSIPTGGTNPTLSTSAAPIQKRSKRERQSHQFTGPNPVLLDMLLQFRRAARENGKEISSLASCLFYSKISAVGARLLQKIHLHFGRNSRPDRPGIRSTRVSDLVKHKMEHSSFQMKKDKSPEAVITGFVETVSEKAVVDEFQASGIPVTG